MSIHVTQKFLANAAGVSQKTVSLFLKGDPHIAGSTRAKLELLCKEHKYFPNMAARSIKNRCFKRIACVLSNVSGRSPHFMAYIRAAALELESQGYSLVIEPFQLDYEGNEVIRGSDFFRTLSVDGAIGLPGNNVPSMVDKTLKDMGVPVVWLNRRSSDPELFCINFEEREASSLLASHLLEKGRRRIAWFGPPGSFSEKPTHYSFGDRLNSVEETLLSNGVPMFRKIYSTYGGNITAAAFELFQGESIPDAVVCYNMSFYNCASHVASYLGVKYGDVDIVAYASEWEFAPAVCDFRTVVLLPEEELAIKGARFICELIGGRTDLDLLRPIPAIFHAGKPIQEDIKIGRRVDRP